MQPSQPIAFSLPLMGEAEARAASDAVLSRWIVGGPRLAEFEARFAALHRKANGIGASSWTSGAFLVLHAWGIGPGDEVVVPSLSFIASANVIRHVGATPVFADIDEETFCVSPADVASKITARTKAILPVDQIGIPCDMAALSAIACRHGLKVLQDAACAVGAKAHGIPVGQEADAAVFSLHARKIVTTGEGGMILTDDADLTARLRLLRHQGMSLTDFQRKEASPAQFETYPEVGYNARLTDIQAAIGLAQLDRLDQMLSARRAIAARYDAALAGNPWLRLPRFPDWAHPNHQSYMVRLRPGAPVDRNGLIEELWRRGVPTRRGVMASHLEAPYAGLAKLPVTEQVVADSLMLPLHPELTDVQIDYVVQAIGDILPG